MFSKKLLLPVTIFFFTSFFTLAQDKDTVIVEDKEGVKDTIIIQDNEWNNDEDNDNDWERDFGKDWGDHWDFDFGDFHGKPAVSLNYGFSELKRDDYDFKLPKPNLVEGKLGYMSEKSEWTDDVISYRYKYFRLSNFTTDLSDDKNKVSGFESNMWRFGFGREGGYGWRFGESAIIPYHSYTLDWTRVEFKNFPDLSLFDSDSNGVRNINILNQYNETFRFGTSFEAGIKFRLFAGIILEGAYERSLVFERHLFWKWAGSAIIEIAAQGFLDKFIDEIGDSSPYVAPIVNFVLKNALSYGLYELRQEKMNWPFNSAPPLAYDQFKVGMSFMF